MQYMIIERFHRGMLKAVYSRYGEKGRLLPDTVRYINSWISEDLSVCYQLMESDSAEGIIEWTRHWNDLVDFEIIPVISSGEAKTKAGAG